MFAARAPLLNRFRGCRFGKSPGQPNFFRVSLPKHPIHYVQSKTHVLCIFAPFGYLKCTFAKSGPWMPFWHEFGPTKLLSSFSAKTHPIHYLRSNTHILGGFAPLGCSKCNVAKSGPGMPFWHEFELTKLFSSFLAKTQPIHYFRPKSHVLGSFAPFGCRKCPVAKSDPWMTFWHEFRPMKLFLRFSAKMHPIHYVWSNAHVLGGFAPFGCRKYNVAKSGPRMPFGHEFGPMKLLTSFSAKTHPMH